MNVNKISKVQTTPLRNSSSANKPYRSPFNNNNENVGRERIFEQSPVNQSLVKRLKIDVNKDTKKIDIDTNVEPTQSDLNAVKKRIREKRQNINVLKTRLSYKRKHKKEELTLLIENWRQGCIDALDRMVKDVQERQDSSVNLTTILSALNIKKSLIYNSDEFVPEDANDM